MALQRGGQGLVAHVLRLVGDAWLAALGRHLAHVEGHHAAGVRPPGQRRHHATAQEAIGPC